MSRAVWNTAKGSMGNLVEWFDVYTYTTFAAYFKDQFFSPDDPHRSIYTYAIF
ncbi:sugar transporter family protein [Cutibacterium modestum P08]|nr:sugar transporter family protein [Cutibacterium modestum P08]